MKYYRLQINSDKRKSKNFAQMDIFLETSKGQRFFCSKLGDTAFVPDEPDEPDEPLTGRYLTQGKSADVNNIGSTTVAFNQKIPGIGGLALTGATFVELRMVDSPDTYLVLRINRYIDCVDLSRSEFDPWPENEPLKPSDNQDHPIARWFYKAVLIKEQIPENLSVFGLKNWGGAFNIVVTEDLKKQLEALDFDHAFIEFQELEVV